MISKAPTTDRLREAAATPRSSTSQLQRRLARIAQLDAALAALSWALGGAACFALALMLVVTVDVWLGLGSFVRSFVVACLVLIVIALLPAMTRHVRSRIRDERELACIVEKRAGIGFSRLINALQFETDAETHRDEQDARLRDEAVRRGNAAASDMPLWRAVAWQSAAVAMIAALGMLLVVTMHAAIAPRSYLASVPRWLMPWADLPAYTPIQFDVTIVQHPDDRSLREIAALIDGDVLPDAADVVWQRDEADADLLRTAMWPIDAGQFAAPAGGEMSGRFYIDTPMGRSRWYDIAAADFGIDGADLSARMDELIIAAEAIAAEQAALASGVTAEADDEHLRSVQLEQLRIAEQWRRAAARLNSHVVFDKAISGSKADLHAQLDQQNRAAARAMAEAADALAGGRADDAAMAAELASSLMAAYLQLARERDAAGGPLAADASVAAPTDESAASGESAERASASAKDAAGSSAGGGMAVIDESSWPSEGEGAGESPAGGRLSVSRSGGVSQPVDEGVIIAESGSERASSQGIDRSPRAISDIDRRAVPAEHRELTEAYFSQLRQGSD